MKIGIIGVGYIGKSLARHFSKAGHEVKVANSRGPETIESDVLEFGAQPVTASEAVADAEVVILSVPLNRIPEAATLLAGLPEETVVMDTSNYYPMRDGRIEAIEAGQVESEWVTEQLGRPIVKAWNCIGAHSLAVHGKPAGAPGRIALPVAGDRERDRQIGMSLVETSGFDAYDAGPISQSWRQQPGAPCYCTDLTLEELPAALASAEAARLPKRRDILFAAVMERISDGSPIDGEWGTRLSRALYL